MLLRSKCYADFFLWIVVTLFVLFPLSYFLLGATKAFALSDLNRPFFKLLFVSLGVTLGHCLITLFIVAGASLLFAFGSLRGFFSSRVFKSFFSFVSVMAFVLPGVAGAAAYIALAESLSLPVQGVFPIVFVHVSMNVFLVSMSVRRSLLSWLNADGRRVLETLEALGLGGGQVLRFGVWPICRSEMFSWLPLLFVWCFFAFPTVLILGGRPVYSTPEVLLFYSLSSSQSFSRVFVLLAMNLLFSGLAFFFLKRGRAASVEWGSDTPLVGEKFGFENIFLFRIVSKAFCFFVFSSLVFVSLFFMHQILNAKLPDLLFFRALGNSFLLALLSGVGFVFFFFSGMFCSPKTRSFLIAVGMLSGAVLLASWLNPLFLEYLAEKPIFLSYCLVALATNFSLFPLLFRWISTRLNNAPRQQLESLSVLPVPSWVRFRNFYWIYTRDVFFKGLGFVFLWSLGELAFSSFFLSAEPLISLQARFEALRYNFTPLLWVVLALVILSALWTLVFERIERKSSFV